MAENDSVTGLAITIPEEVFSDLDRLEKKIMGLGTITNNIAGNIVASFRKMADGVNPFTTKIEEAERAMKALGSVNISGEFGKSTSAVEKATSSMVKMATVMNQVGRSGDDSVSVWMDISDKVRQLQQRQEGLLATTMEYETALKRIQSSGAYSGTEPEWYSNAREEYEQNEKAIESYRQKQQAIVDNEQALARQQRTLQELKNLESQRTSLPEQRSRQELEKLNEYYRELEKTSAAAAKEQERAAQQAAKAQERQRKEQERLLAAQQKAYRESAKGALESANAARTYNQRAQAMKNLEAAIKNLDRNDQNYNKTLAQLTAAYRRLEMQQRSVRDAMGQMQQQQTHLMDISGQLMRRLALVFSVSQVTQYVQKLAQVRGEFELQNAALAAIMQNKDEADRLFGQITQLAVVSPFNLKELVRYTKELSAYRVENEKLYDTTKMLADVSAGLGVDMSRLILAYGQVKASNYLRGTELRQFSEAGINILGELATYFSEIEQRAVSVGEVFDMVSRRMVTFQDVEKIFQQITSEGGIFANMQEVQSRTLAGMVSNLQDAVDIMLNDIGKETEGTLKGAVNLMRQLVENWRTVAAIGKGVLIPLASYLAIMKTITFLNKQYNASQSIIIPILKTIVGLKRKETLAQLGLNAAANANPYILGASIIIGAITAIVSLIRNATKEQREFDRTVTEGVSKSSELSANFERLANIATSNTSSSEEQTAAIEEMNRTYGELIPSQYRNIKALKEMNGDYSTVTQAINAKIDAQTREKMVQDALTNSSEKTNDLYQNIINRIQDTGVSMDTAMKVTREFQRQLKEGLIPSRDAAYDSFIKILSDYTGQDYSNFLNFGGVSRKVRKLYDEASNLQVKLDEIKNMDFSEYRVGGGTLLFQNLSNNLNDVIKTTEDYKKQLQESDFKFTYSIELDEAAKDLQIKNIQDFINQLQRQIDEGIIDEKDVASVRNVIENANDAISKIKVSPIIEEIQDLRIEYSKLYDIDFNKLSFTEKLETENFDEYVKKVGQNVEELEGTVNKLDEAARKGETIPPLDLQNMLGNMTEEQLRNKAKAVRAFYDAIYYDYDEKKSRAYNKKGINDIINLFKELRSQYAKLRKDFSEEDATAMIRTSYEQTALDVGLPEGYLTTMTFDTSGIIEGTKKIYETTTKEGQQALNKFTDGLNTEVEIEVKVKEREKIQDEIDSLFSDYEMTVEIQKLGGDVSWADLFGIDWTTIGDVQAEADEAISKLTELGGEKAKKQIKNIQKRVQTAIENEQKTWAKKFADILSKSVDEIQAVQQKGLKGIGIAKQFFDEEKLSAEQYAAVIKSIVGTVNEETSKITLDKFKQSSDYIQAMGDMSAYSTLELQRLLNRLKEVVAASAGNMDAENLKTYMDAIQNVQDALNQRKSPFQKNEIAQVQELNRLEAEFSQEQERQNMLLQEQEMWKQRVADAQERLNKLQEKQKAGDDSQETADAINQADADLIEATENLQNANNEVKTSQANLSTISGKIGNIIGDVSAAMFKIEAVFNAVIDGINGAIDLFGNISELADSFGIDTEEGEWSDAKIFFDSLGEVSQGAVQAFQSFSSGDIFGGITSSISMLLDIVKFFNQIHDNQREKIIIAETEKVERLAEAYEDLEKAFDDAMDASDFRRYSAGLTQNYQAQMAAYDRMIAAEKDKKNPDEDTIKEWENAQKELAESYADNIEEALVEAGGVARSDYLDTARDFVDAWVDAFQETGDGLSGLQDNFDEFFLNILQQQAAMTISKNFIQPLLDDLNDKLGDNFELDEQEKQEWYNKVKETVPELSAALEALLGPWLEQLNTDEGSLSGLQKGIQGVTEETAQIIEALLNSMRYYVADSNSKLNSIYLILSGNEAYPNPMLAELRTQTELIRATNRLIRNVTASGHPNGGDGIKVFMN